ncbi:hypothetical protein, partial [Pseudomonas viridiflava]|uniref:hypothetical protein n=1 Tax=Pseudomonas viridiflava TaxID=33069 RepID=UPI00197FC85B
YSALLESGQSLEGTLILTRNAKGEVSNDMMSHSPYRAVEMLVGTMNADRATRSGAKRSWFSKALSYADWISQ